MSRGNAKLEVGQLVLTSSTPPGNLGLYAYDQDTIGVVGDLVCIDPKSKAESSVVTSTVDPVTGRIRYSAGGTDLVADLGLHREFKSSGLPLWETGVDNGTYSGGANAPLSHAIAPGLDGAVQMTTAVGAWSEITFPAPGRYCNSGNFSLRVYIPPSEIQNMSGITVMIGTTGFVKYVSKAFTPSETLHGGWQTLYIDKTRLSASAGVMDYSTDVINAVKVRITPNASVSMTMAFKAIYGGSKSKARLIITSDDNFATWVNRAVPLLDYYGLKSGIGVIANTVGSGGVFASLRDLQRAVEDGHECFPHGTAATLGAGNLSQWTTEDQVFADISANQNFVLNNGLSVADSHLFYAYPQNVIHHSYGDRRILNAVQRAGILAARAGARGGALLKWTSQLAGPFDKFSLPIIGHLFGGFALDGAGAEAANIAAIQTDIQNLGVTGSYSTLMFHRVSDAGAENVDGLDISISNLDAICQTIKTEVDAGRLEVWCPSDIVGYVKSNKFSYG